MTPQFTQRQLFSLVIGLCVVLAISTFSFSFFSRSVSDQNTVTKPAAKAPLPSKQSQSTPGKLFTSADYCLTLTYPLTWDIQPASEGCGPVFTPANTHTVFLTVCGPYVASEDTPENIALRSIPSVFFTQRELTIAGHKTIQQEFTSNDGNGYLYQVNTFIGDVDTTVNYGNGQTEKQKGTIAVYFTVQDKEKQAEAKKTFEQIVSTIQFKK